MTSDQILEWARASESDRWDHQPATGWSIADLDHHQVALTVDEAVRCGRMSEPETRSLPDLLRGLNLMLPDGHLTRAAVVLFGHSARLDIEYPQCMLRVARFRGTTRTEFLDNRQFHGHSFELLCQATKFLMETVPIAGRIIPGVIERVDEPLYPVEALREAIVNAICYRDYSIGGGSLAIGVYDDRLEVTSSGNLPFGLTPEVLFAPHESLLWNPLIARAFYLRGIIERRGKGYHHDGRTCARGRPAGDRDRRRRRMRYRALPVGPLHPPHTVERILSDPRREILSLIDQASGAILLRDIVVRSGRLDATSSVDGDRLSAGLFAP